MVICQTMKFKSSSLQSSTVFSSGEMFDPFGSSNASGSILFHRVTVGEKALCISWYS